MVGSLLIAFAACIAFGLFLWVAIDFDELGGIFIVIGIVGIICTSLAGIRHKLNANRDIRNKLNANSNTVDEQLEHKYYEMIYTKFVKKFNLTDKQFARIKGETKSELVKRIRMFMDNTDPKIKQTVAELEPTQEEQLKEQIKEQTGINIQFAKKLTFENNW